MLKNSTKYRIRSFAVVLGLAAAVGLGSTPVNALELVQDENPVTHGPRVPASDIIFNHDFNPRTGFTYELGEKFRAYEKVYTVNNGSQCAGNERPSGRCEITENDNFVVFYAPEEGELVRGEEKFVPGRMIKLVYTDVAQDIDGERLDFVVELSNLKITPIPNLPDTSTVQPPKQEWSVLNITTNGLIRASASKWSRPSAEDVQYYIDCYRDTSCDVSDASGKFAVRNEYINDYDITFSFYKTGTTELANHNVTFDFRDLDGVRTDRKVPRSWDGVGTPIVREGIQLKSGVSDGKVYAINPLVPGEDDNNGFRLRVSENNTILEAPCYHFSGSNPIVADGDQDSNCKAWNDDETYNSGFAVIFQSTGSFAWHSGSTLNTNLLNTLGSILSLEKSVSQSEVKVGDNFEYNIKVTHRTDTDPVSENIVLEDTISDKLEITSVPEYCTVSGQKITCTIPPEVFNASGGEMNFPIGLKVKEAFSGSITGTAYMNIGLYDNCDTNRIKLDNNGGKQCSASVDITSIDPVDPDDPVVPDVPSGEETVVPALPNTGTETWFVAAVAGVILMALLGASLTLVKREK